MRCLRCLGPGLFNVLRLQSCDAYDFLTNGKGLAHALTLSDTAVLEATINALKRALEQFPDYRAPFEAEGGLDTLEGLTVHSHE